MTKLSGKSANQNILMYIISFLVICVITISFVNRKSTTINHNNIENIHDTKEIIIFDDIKLVINKDSFS